MSERSIRRRAPATGQKSKPPQPTPSPHRRTRSPRRSKPTKPIKVLHRCSSEPILWTKGLVLGDDESHSSKTDVALFRRQTCMDIFTSPSPSPSPSAHNHEKYSKDAKVVVNVTVEGSPGPVRAMVRLGASVEETIRVVADKYGEEGRSPTLDRNAASSFQLHHTYFSLDSFDKTETIGEIGSRNFYLRKNDGDRNSYNDVTQLVSSFSSSSMPEIAPERAIAATPMIAPTSSFLFFPSYIARKISKIVRRTLKLWKLLGCMQCG